MSTETTHFGYQDVPIEEKVKRVEQVFDSVARQYDVMNDLMSLGIHRLWKQFTLGVARARSGMTVLDLAGGTGDLAKAFLKQVGPTGLVVLADINDAMLEAGREKSLNQGISGLHYLQTDAEQLPFPDQTFDRITIAFGLRNVTRKEVALSEMYRVLKLGGHALVLEFSQPYLPGLGPIYDLYSFSVLPRLGQLVANDAASYQYLAESIRKHPDQDTLKAMMIAAGFEGCDYFNLTGGIVALHRGYRLS